MSLQAQEPQAPITPYNNCLKNIEELNELIAEIEAIHRADGWITRDHRRRLEELENRIGGR